MNIAGEKIVPGRSERKAALLSTICWLPLSLAATAAHAQDRPVDVPAGVSGAAPIQAASTDGAEPVAQDEEQTNGQRAADIIVTGSRLRGVQPIGSTVVTVNRETIVASGATSVDQVAAQVPSLSGLGFGEGSRSTQGGNNNSTAISAANLRGLGPSATLTLVNGHRQPLSGNGAYAVDLNSVPTIALERVEVLADGASAVYGSDAIAGVVNLITRRNGEGFEFTARRGFADGYDDWRVGVLAGHRWSTGQITVAFEQNNHSRLAGDQRPYNTRDAKAPDTSCFPGNAVVNGVFYPIQANGAIGAASTPNTCKPNGANDYLPKLRRTNGALTVDLDLADWIKFRGDANYSYRATSIEYAHLPSTLDIPESNPFFQLPPGVALATLPNCTGALATQRCLRVNYYVGGAIGQTRTYRSEEETYAFHPSLDFALGGNWNLTTEATYGGNESDTFGFGFNSALLTAAARGTTLATALDPFANRTNPQVLANIANNVSGGKSSVRLTVYDATITGPLFHLPGGDVKLAVNGEYRKEHFVGRNRSGTYDAPLVVRGYDRTVKAASGEINVPLFGPGNAIPGIEALDLSVAARYEKYSDFGETTNPKFSANWSPLRGVVLKGSYSTAFHAAGAAQLVGALPPTSVYLNAADPLAGGAARPTLQINAPNPDLKPETSKNLSFALELTPELIPHFQASASYFKIDYKDVIQGQFNNPDILNQAATFSSLIIRNPTAAQIAATTALYPAVNVAAGTPVAIIDGRPNNLGRIREEGVDLQLSYNLPTANAGTFNLFANGTYLWRYDVNATPTAPTVDQLDKYGFPVNLKGRGGVSWAMDGINATLFGNYIDSYTFGADTVKSWTTFDAYVGYTFKGTRLLNDLTIGVNVTNVFDKAPPFVNISAYLFNPGGFDPAQASALGRLVALNISKKI